MSMPHDPRPMPPAPAAMGDPNDQHARHDPLLVARFVADDVDGTERAEPVAWLASCPTCADLAADLRAVSAGLRAMPGPRRTRDFRLTADDAARLRRRGWRGFLDALATGRLTWAQPLGATLAALGIVGLMVGTFSLGGPGTPATTMDQSRPGVAPAYQGGGAGPVASAAPATPGSNQGGTGAVFGPSAAPSTESNLQPSGPPPSGAGSKSASASATPAPAFNAASLPPGSTPAAASPATGAGTGGAGGSGSGNLPRDLLLAASFALVVAGVGLLALRFVGRRPGAATGR